MGGRDVHRRGGVREPSSLIGSADADFLVDGCLVEVKTTKRPASRREDLYQLLGYALLDFENPG